MTVDVLPRRKTYRGNGQTTTFTVPFQFFELAVYRNGSLRTLVTDYTITQTAPGLVGSVVFNTPPAAGDLIVIIGKTRQVQEADYVADDAFPAESHERALDRLALAIQEIQLGLDFTLRVDPALVEGPPLLGSGPGYLYFDRENVPRLTQSLPVQSTLYPFSVSTGRGTGQAYDFNIVEMVTVPVI